MPSHHTTTHTDDVITSDVTKQDPTGNPVNLDQYITSNLPREQVEEQLNTLVVSGEIHADQMTEALSKYDMHQENIKEDEEEVDNTLIVGPKPFDFTRETTTTTTNIPVQKKLILAM